MKDYPEMVGDFGETLNLGLLAQLVQQIEQKGYI